VNVKVKRIRKASIAKIIGALSPDMVEDLLIYSQKFWKRKAPLGPPKMGQHSGSGAWPAGKPGQYKDSIVIDYKKGDLSGRVLTKDPGAAVLEYGTKIHTAQPSYRPTKKAGEKRIRTLIKKIIKKIREQSIG